MLQLQKDFYKIIKRNIQSIASNIEDAKDDMCKRCKKDTHYNYNEMEDKLNELEIVTNYSFYIMKLYNSIEKRGYFITNDFDSYGDLMEEKIPISENKDCYKDWRWNDKTKNLKYSHEHIIFKGVYCLELYSFSEISSIDFSKQCREWEEVLLSNTSFYSKDIIIEDSTVKRIEKEKYIGFDVEKVYEENDNNYKKEEYQVSITDTETENEILYVPTKNKICYYVNVYWDVKVCIIYTEENKLKLKQ